METTCARPAARHPAGQAQSYPRGSPGGLQPGQDRQGLRCHRRGRAQAASNVKGHAHAGSVTAPDLRHATVYVSVLGNEKKQAATMRGLEAAHGVLQSRLARELRMKRTPQLTFEYDPSVEHGVRMSKLIDDLAPEADE